MNFDNPMLMSVEKKPLMATIVGGPGMGKTSLGALFPDPIFIKTEDGTNSIDGIALVNPEFKRSNVAVFGSDGKEILFDKSSDVLAAINWLRTGKHTRKTLVIDSLPALESIFTKEILDLETNPKVKNMNAAHGGFGTAWEMVADKHKELIRHCRQLAIERDMMIVFICHEALETIESADVAPYMKATLLLNPGTQKKPGSDCRSPYIQACDLIAFIRQDFFVVGDKTKKEIEKKGNVGRATEANPDGSRIISCYTTPTNCGKNRWGIQGPIPYDLTCNPFEQFLGGK